MVILLISIYGNAESSELNDNPLFYISKTIMIIGLCISIYMRLKTFKHHGNRVTKTLLTNANPTDHDLSIFEASDDNNTVVTSSQMSLLMPHGG